MAPFAPAILAAAASASAIAYSVGASAACPSAFTAGPTTAPAARVHLRGHSGSALCAGAVPSLGSIARGLALAARPWEEEGEEEWSPQQNWGWNAELGKWVDWKGDGKKWWQKPGFLTPNGYPEPPHWNMKNYKLSLEELKLAKAQADIVANLKKRGWTYKEIEARAKMYEFIEDESPGSQKVTDKLKFLFQIQALERNQDANELIDVRYVPRYKLDWEDEFEQED